MNLALNAQDAMPEGAQLSITTKGTVILTDEKGGSKRVSRCRISAPPQHSH
jgi:hypothetical protein